MIKYLLTTLFCCQLFMSFGQDRIAALTTKLELLAEKNPGLKKPVDFSVVGVSIQEFLRGLAEANDLNISIDPSLDVEVYNNFTNEPAINVLLLLCQEYTLTIDVIGTIMSIHRFEVPVVQAAAKPLLPLDIQYQASSDKLSVNLKNDSLQKIVQVISEKSGKNVLLSPKISKDELVSLYIKNVPFQSAVAKLAYAIGLKLTLTEDEFFLLEPNDNLDEGADRSSARSRGSKGKRKKPSTDELEVEVIDLEKGIFKINALNVSINEVIQEVSSQLGQNYFLFSEPKGNTTCTLGKVNYEEFLSFILKGSDYTFKEEDAIYLIGERKIEGLRTTKVVKLKYRTYEEVSDHIPSDLKNGVEIKEFNDLNSIILSGSTPQILEIESFLAQIDRVVPVVMIEVIFVDIDRTRTLNTGVRAGLSDSTVNPTGTLMGEDGGFNVTLGSKQVNQVTGPLNLGNVGSNFYLSLQAAEAQQFAKIKSTPKLATLNGHEATLVSGETRYYFNEKQNTVGGINNNTIVTREPVAVQADLSIKIKPMVSGDEQVTLDINVEVTDFAGNAPDNAPPPSITKSFTSMIRVKNEDMVVLGGIEREEKSSSSKGIPFLARIPIIKWFFSSQSRTKSKKISLVFIRPTVIY